MITKTLWYDRYPIPSLPRTILPNLEIEIDVTEIKKLKLWLCNKQVLQISLLYFGISIFYMFRLSLFTPYRSLRHSTLCLCCDDRDSERVSSLFTTDLDNRTPMFSPTTSDQIKQNEIFSSIKFATQFCAFPTFTFNANYFKHHVK